MYVYHFKNHFNLIFLCSKKPKKSCLYGLWILDVPLPQIFTIYCSNCINKLLWVKNVHLFTNFLVTPDRSFLLPLLLASCDSIERFHLCTWKKRERRKLLRWYEKYNHWVHALINSLTPNAEACRPTFPYCTKRPSPITALPLSIRSLFEQYWKKDLEFSKALW